MYSLGIWKEASVFVACTHNHSVYRHIAEVDRYWSRSGQRSTLQRVSVHTNKLTVTWRGKQNHFSHGQRCNFDTLVENFSKAKKSAEVVDSSPSFISFMSEDDVIPRARAQVNKSPRAGLPVRNHLDKVICPMITAQNRQQARATVVGTINREIVQVKRRDKNRRDSMTKELLRHSAQDDQRQVDYTREHP